MCAGAGGGARLGQVALIDSFPVTGDDTAPVQSPWQLNQLYDGIELYRKKSRIPAFYSYLARYALVSWAAAP